jgi:hypothetical protein
MSCAEPTLSSTDATDSLDGWERALLDRQLEALNRLADMGMALAAAVTLRATADEPAADADLQRAAIDFARVSRAVRMTFALQSRLIAEFKGGSRPAQAAAPDNGPIEVRWANADLTEEEAVQQRLVQGIVQRLAESAALESETAERLAFEAGERIEDDNLHRDLTKRPVGEVVALICKDLGLEPDWDRVAGEWWARSEINRSPPGSPFAGWKAGRAEELPPLARAPPLAGELSRSD